MLSGKLAFVTGMAYALPTISERSERSSNHPSVYLESTRRASPINKLPQEHGRQYFQSPHPFRPSERQLLSGPPSPIGVEDPVDPLRSRSLHNISFLPQGAGSGIGRATCLVLAREGAQVVAADRNVKSAKETISLIDGPGNHTFEEVDVSQLTSVETVIKNILKNYARAPNVVVNSAGITKDEFLLKMSPTTFNDAINVNLIGTFNVVQASCNRLVESKQPGSVIAIGSIVGQIGNIGQSNYAASKAGVEAFTRSVAKEMGSFGIRCNTVVPGLISTPIIETVPDKVKQLFKKQIPLARFGEPSEVAELIAFLGSDRSSYINGTSINIAGGL